MKQNKKFGILFGFLLLFIGGCSPYDNGMVIKDKGGQCTFNGDCFVFLNGHFEGNTFIQTYGGGDIFPCKNHQDCLVTKDLGFPSCINSHNQQGCGKKVVCSC